MNSIVQKHPAPVKTGIQQIDDLRALLDPSDDQQRLNAMIKSIKAQGQLVPIVMAGQTVIDGQMRVAACKALRKKPLNRSGFPGGSNL